VTLGPVATQLQISGPRLPPELVGPLRAILERSTWGLWCTLYVDSSNAGGGALTCPERPAHGWAWGARGRATDVVADLLGAPRYLTLSGLSPEAGGKDSGVAELWGIVHAVRACLGAWPWLAGVGVRCDNLEAVNAVAGCDGRGRCDDGPRRLRPARHALCDVVSATGGVHLRATHVRGHGRADLDRQKAFNRDADLLARGAARSANRCRT